VASAGALGRKFTLEAVRLMRQSGRPGGSLTHELYGRYAKRWRYTLAVGGCGSSLPCVGESQKEGGPHCSPSPVSSPIEGEEQTSTSRRASWSIEIRGTMVSERPL
jgi:hypothetical protein